jgi:hypothetical protein
MQWYTVEGTKVVGGDECYHFQTKSVATKFADILNRDAQKYSWGVSLTSMAHPCTISLNSAINHFVISETGKEIFRMSQNGRIEKFNLPYLVWVWFRSTSCAKALKTLWYGQGVKA